MDEKDIQEEEISDDEDFDQEEGMGHQPGDRAYVVPSIISDNYRDMEHKVKEIFAATNRVHIDTMDGGFTAKPCWPYIKPDLFFSKIVEGDQGLPLWEHMDYDVHLMCRNPQTLVDDWISAGMSRVFVHAEALSSIELQNLITDKSDTFVSVGPALLLNTPVASLELDSDQSFPLLLMSIARIGSYGEPFDERVLQKIKDARLKFPKATIIVDGGVNETNIESIVEAGADEVVAGSAVWESTNPIDAVHILEDRVLQYRHGTV